MILDSGLDKIIINFSVPVGWEALESRVIKKVGIARSYEKENTSLIQGVGSIISLGSGVIHNSGFFQLDYSIIINANSKA